jgi:hypothetical protein
MQSYIVLFDYRVSLFFSDTSLFEWEEIKDYEVTDSCLCKGDGVLKPKNVYVA